MKERPILFKKPMVRAILDWRKTQTRRVMKPQPAMADGSFTDWERIEQVGRLFHVFANRPHKAVFTVKCPYGQIGDRLWVRETWREKSRTSAQTLVHYLADDAERWMSGRVLPFDFARQQRIRPSIFMPRWASRITLEITCVRVERVCDISGYDAIREGSSYHDTTSSLSEFRYLWDVINAKRGYGWDSNPFVWVIDFKQVKDGLD